jgi:hypothetical protein
VTAKVRGNLAVWLWLIVILATARMAPAKADQAGIYGPELEGFEYPFPTERFSFPSQGQTVSMTFMDVAPEKPNVTRLSCCMERIFVPPLGKQQSRR